MHYNGYIQYTGAVAFAKCDQYHQTLLYRQEDQYGFYIENVNYYNVNCCSDILLL